MIDSTTKKGHALWPWIVLAAVVLLVALLHTPFFNNFVVDVTDWAQGLMKTHPVLGGVVFFVFSALSAMLAFASSAVLVPPANLAWGKVVTFFLLWGGWTAGAMVAFGIGRLAFPFLIRLGYEEKLEKYRQFVSGRMKFWAVLLFCIAVPSEIPGYLFGAARYPFLKFLAAMAIAESIYALGIVVAGEGLLAAKPSLLLGALGVLIVIVVTAGVVLRMLKRRKAGGMSSR